jgi:mersacidin/lichenicidin family type 2 lantibiotic
MSHKAAIRAWKDPEYRLSLTEAERAALPASPAGMKELSDADLTDATGGATSTFLTFCRTEYTCQPATCCNSLCSVSVGCTRSVR